MRYRTIVVGIPLLIALCICLHARAGESSYSLSDPKLKTMLNWRVTTPPDVPTTQYSVHDVGTDTWRVVTDPTELAALMQHTKALDDFNNISPQQRAENSRNEMIAQAMQSSAAASKPDTFRVAIQILRGVLGLAVLVLFLISAIRNRKRKAMVASSQGDGPKTDG